MHANRIGAGGNHQRQLGHVLQPDGRWRRVFLQAGRARLHQPQGFLHQGRVLNAGHLARVVQHGNVQAAVLQVLLHGTRQAFADGQLRLGHFAAKGTGERHGQHAGHAGRQAQGHAPGEAGAHPAQLFAGAFDLVQDAAAVFQQQLAGLGWGGAAAVAHQQVLPKLDLQQAHLSAQCRLGHVQGLRGAGEAAQLGHAHKVFQLFEVHSRPLGFILSYPQTGYADLF